MKRLRTTRTLWAALVLVFAAVSNVQSAASAQDPRNVHKGSAGIAAAGFSSYAFISNGTLSLGINAQGHLNATSGTSNLGLKFLPTAGDALIPGCWCEGWGLADTAAGTSGWASVDNGGVSSNLSIAAFHSTAESAESVVEIGSALRVRHTYHPSPRPELYQVDRLHLVVDVQHRRAGTD